MDSRSPDTVVTAECVMDVDRLGDEIAVLSAHLDAASARLLDLIREFDGARWLGQRLSVLCRLAGLARRARRGRRARESACRARTRNALDRNAENRESVQQHKSRALHVYPDEDGMVIVRGRLMPEVGALLLRALEAARETVHQPLRVEANPTIAQQQADALALLAETALHAGLDPGTPGERYQIVVHVDAAVLADPDQPGQSILDGGAHVPAETSRRLACDASRVVMRHDADGHVVEIGARTRTIPAAIRRALHHRDHGCRFPGCGLPFGQGHHIKHWAQGGSTTLSSLAMLCRRPPPRGPRRGVSRRTRTGRRPPLPMARWAAFARRTTCVGRTR